MQPEPRHPVPRPAAWLGAFGLIPFLAGACAPWVLSVDQAAQTTVALAGYGAVILSFMGGVHWGLAIAGSAAPAGGVRLQLGLSVVPALVAWMALLVPAATALVVLFIAFALLLAGDLIAVSRKLAPAWYPRLRVPLTLVVLACLLTAAAAG